MQLFGKICMLYQLTKIPLISSVSVEKFLSREQRRVISEEKFT